MEVEGARHITRITSSSTSSTKPADSRCKVEVAEALQAAQPQSQCACCVQNSQIRAIPCAVPWLQYQ